MNHLFDTPDEVDEKIVKAAVPMIGGVAVTAVGIGLLNACCGFKAKKFAILPVGMAAITAAVAAWAYLNPEAIPDEIDDLPEPIRKRISS